MKSLIATCFMFFCIVSISFSQEAPRKSSLEDLRRMTLLRADSILENSSLAKAPRTRGELNCCDSYYYASMDLFDQLESYYKQCCNGRVDINAVMNIMNQLNYLSNSNCCNDDNIDTAITLQLVVLLAELADYPCRYDCD